MASRTETTTDDALLTCEAALRRAQLASDVTELDRLLDEVLVFTGPDGDLYSKADDLDAHRTGTVRITRLEAMGFLAAEAARGRRRDPCKS